jgi:Ca2+-binding EF-hand superfamily protein
VGEAEATRVLQEFDRNKDGVLSLDEFRRLVQQRQRAAAPLSPGFFGGLEWSEKEIRHAFSRFDANSSGKLDYKELRQALRALGADVEHADAVSVLQSCMPE